MIHAEFWSPGASYAFASVKDVGAVPREGGLISIAKKTWRVSQVTWALDHLDDFAQSKLRANIEVVPA